MPFAKNGSSSTSSTVDSSQLLLIETEEEAGVNINTDEWSGYTTEEQLSNFWRQYKCLIKFTIFACVFISVLVICWVLGYHYKGSALNWDWLGPGVALLVIVGLACCASIPFLILACSGVGPQGSQGSQGSQRGLH